MKLNVVTNTIVVPFKFGRNEQRNIKQPLHEQKFVSNTHVHFSFYIFFFFLLFTYKMYANSNF